MKQDRQPRCGSSGAGVWSRVLAGCVLYLLLFLSSLVSAQTSSPAAVVYIAGPNNNPALTRHITNLISDALGDTAQLRPFRAGQTSHDTDSLVITLGPEAFTQVRQESRSIPILALLVDRRFIKGYADRSDGTVGAVLYDSPLLRQAMAGKVILPHATRVAMLATPESVELYEELIPRLPDIGLEGQVFVISQASDLIPTLIRALDYGDFLLAAPDNSIYNPRTIKHLLLTTYRRNRIVIGPSQAYVKAGALASTYLPLQAIADAAAELVNEYQRLGRFPPPLYPDTFRLEINRQVARSLNIPLPPREQLRAAIEEMLSSQRENSDE